MATTLFNKTALANGTSNLIVRSDALHQSTDLVQAGVVLPSVRRWACSVSRAAATKTPS
jgi:hypothetical protein